MKRVGSRQLKSRLARYLRIVRAGETVLVTHRGIVVARLEPAQDGESARQTLDARLRELEAQGHIRLASRPLGKFTPRGSKGKPASQMISEARR